MGGRLAVALAMALLAPPTRADVRAGADAWKRGDYAAAVAAWRGPAERGDADAQFDLGQAYKLGRGVSTDQAKAIDWFRKAAAQNHVLAQDNYALALFQAGRKAEAAPWLERAAARDEKRAELVLGTMLFNGDAVARDWPRAYALVTRSSQQGVAQAVSALAVMDRHLPEAQRRDGLAMAQQIAARGRPTVATAATVTSAPPIAAASARTGADPVPAAVRTAAPPPRPVASSPAPAARVTTAVRAAAPPPRPVAPAPTAGTWRVQLGAFRDAANARGLWQKVGAQTGGTPAYVEGNGLTRLQASGFASKAEAQRACERVGGGCVVLSP